MKGQGTPLERKKKIHYKFPPNCPSVAVSLSSEKGSKPNTLLSLNDPKCFLGASLQPATFWSKTLQVYFENQSWLQNLSPSCMSGRSTAGVKNWPKVHQRFNAMCESHTGAAPGLARGFSANASCSL